MKKNAQMTLQVVGALCITETNKTSLFSALHTNFLQRGLWSRQTFTETEALSVLLEGTGTGTGMIRTVCKSFREG